MISVLMVVCKTDNYVHLDCAIKSIYELQNYKPTEVVIVKNGIINIDAELVLDEWEKKFPNIFKIVFLSGNSMFATALNFGINSCTNDLIARMDPDDISLPNRPLKQYKYLKKNKDITICGSFVSLHSNDMKIHLGNRHVPISHNEIVNFAKFRCPMNHPTVMIRKSVFDHNIEYPKFTKAQDYALWVKLISLDYKFSNLPEVLVKMRMADEEFGKRGFEQLCSEILVLNYHRKLGFLRPHEFLRNTLTRLVTRTLPNSLKKFTYKHFILSYKNNPNE